MVVLVVVGAGAVSTMPTFNGKTLKVPSHAILPFLALIALIGGIIVISPRTVYLVLGLYIASFPFLLWLFTVDAGILKPVGQQTDRRCLS